MVSEHHSELQLLHAISVLILVVMEDGFGEKIPSDKQG